MKAVLMSIHPNWCEKIFNGEKTIEVRKTAPKLETPFTVYVYCTKGKMYLYRNPNNGELFLDSNGSYRGGDYEDRYLTGKVIGSFVCDRVEEIPCYLDAGTYPEYLIEKEELNKTCLSYDELFDYLNGKDGCGWHITEPKLFDKPRELGEFWLYNDELNRRYEHDENFCCYDGTDENGEATTDCDDKNINNCYLCWEEWSGWCHKLTRAPQSWCYVEDIE